MVKRSILHEQKPEIHISLPRIVSGKCISSSSATEVWRETLAPHRRKMVWRKNQQTQAQENIAPVARNWREAAGVVGVIFRIISHDSALISFSQRSTVAAQCCRNIAKWFVPYSLDLWRLLVLQEYGFQFTHSLATRATRSVLQSCDFHHQLHHQTRHAWYFTVACEYFLSDFSFSHFRGLSVLFYVLTALLHNSFSHLT